EVDFTDLYYWLNFYYENPLNLNKATSENLQNLYILSQSQIQALITHRQQFGNFISIFELQAVPEFDITTIEKILPFVAVDNQIEQKNYSAKQIFTQGRHDLFLRHSQTLETEAGYNYPNEKYRFKGDPFGLQLRYNYRFGNTISYGFTAEKDAGEEFFTGTQKQGFDFYSAHFFYTGNKFVKSVALGDYQVQFGQGLTVWSSLSFGKSANVMNIARQARGIFPSRGANEFQFMRGAATSLQIKDFTLTVFGSQKKVDANALRDTFSDRAVEVSSLLLGGYHRNNAELEDKRTLTERAAGGEILYRKSNLKLGISGTYGSYSAPISSDKDLNSIYNTAGKYFGNIGISYSYLYKNAYLFGETSRSLNGGLATVNGLLLSLHSRLDAGILYRNYSPKYNAVYSAAIGESSKNSNEEGTYLSAAYKINRAWNLNVYADVFKFKWLRYRVDAPSKGYEYLANLIYKPSKKWDAQIRYRLQNKDINASASTEKIHTPVESILQQLRFQVSLKATENLSLRSRAEFSQYSLQNSPKENGFMVFQDVDYQFSKFPLSITVRYTFFDIESYNARIYTYENDVRFAYSVPALQDEGIRSYILLQYRLKRRITLYGRIARTQLYNRETISSGLTEIDAPHRTEVKFQLQYSF
ncbi:MAG: ComEA family DNA-binding protein, partial [Bacteroidia bacterium]